MPNIYINKNIFQDKRLFTVCRVGFGKAEKLFCIERDKSYPFCNIHYVNSGQMIVEFRGVKHTVKKGQMFILPPFEAHKYWSTSSEILDINWLEFSCGGICDISKEILKDDNLVFSMPSSYKVNKCIRNIFRVIFNEPIPKYYLSKVIYLIIMTLIEDCDFNNSKTTSRSNLDIIEVIIQYIDSNIKSKLDIKELAKVSGYSQSYFGKLFLKIVGIAPAKYILNRRISLAKEQLCRSNEKLDNIAILLGFYDTSHFIRVFKKAEGLTPAEFKKQITSYTHFMN